MRRALSLLHSHGVGAALPSKSKTPGSGPSALVATLGARFDSGQKLLRLNAGVPIIDQQRSLDQFESYLEKECGVNQTTLDTLRKMRYGSLMNLAGGASGSKLNVGGMCLAKSKELLDAMVQAYFQSSSTARLEIFPSTTKSIEATLSLLAHEGEVRERPTKIILPKDAHYAWGNAARGYSRNSFMRIVSADPARGFEDLKALNLRPGDRVVCIFTWAATVSGRSTDRAWFDKTLDYVRAKQAVPLVFVDAALAGCATTSGVAACRDDALNRAAIPSSGALLGLVQSGFKDFLPVGSLLFFDDEFLECCGRNAPAFAAGNSSLASTVAGGAHPLITLAPVTSIPETPLLAYLAFADEYTGWRVAAFQRFRERLEEVALLLLPVPHTVRSLYPLLHLVVEDADLVRNLYAAPELAPYSLISIDAEPNVLRLFVTPTNECLVDAVGAAIRRVCGVSTLFDVAEVRSDMRLSA